MMKKITFLMAVLATTLSFGQAMTNGDFSTAGTLPGGSPGTGLGWYGSNAAIGTNEGELLCTAFSVLKQDVNFVEAGLYTFTYSVKTDASPMLKNTFIKLITPGGDGTAIELLVADSNNPTSETYIGALKTFQSKFGAIDGSYKEHSVTLNIADPNTVLTLFISINSGTSDTSTDKVYIDDVSFTKVPTLAVAANNENTPSFSCYPNPAKNTINVAAAEAIDSVVLLNTMGQTVASTVIGSTSGKIDVTNVASGVYILSTTINGVVSSQRVVIE
jgi:hypothetical protein